MLQPDYMAMLNPQQRSAVETTRGPLLVLAGAGTGKTRVVTARIAHIVRGGVPSARILAVTFTRKAAREMYERVRALLGPKAKGLTISTYHALGFRILREWSAETGRGGRLRVLTEQERRRLAGQLLDEANSSLDVEAVLGAISQAKNAGIRPDEYRSRCRDDRESATATVYERYQAQLAAGDAIDMDDMVLRPLELLESCERIRQAYQRRWDYLLIDEYQDTSEGQDRLTSCLLNPDRNLCVVGDDDQSIYAFRGADVERIRSFAHRIAGAATVTLESNYRSRSPIIALANAIIANSPARLSKRLVSEAGPGAPVEWAVLSTPELEMKFISSRVREFGWAEDWSSIAILARLRHHVASLIDGLRRRGVPCSTGANERGVTVMTLHQAKGLEFPIVFLPFMEDGVVPHKHAIPGTDRFEEERRLLYVGITRARERLILSSAKCWSGRPSSFLVEAAKAGALRQA